MKHINYILLLISLSFLYTLLITTNSPLMLQTQSPIYATTAEQEGNDQEETQTSSDENDNDSDKANGESKSSKETTESEQSESDITDDDKNHNDFPSAKQDNDCTNTSDINSNIPIYIGHDGCKYPCPLPESTDQSNIPVGCPTGPTSTSQPITGLSNGNTLQSEKQPQQNPDSNSNQNAFVSPTINSDTSSAISNGETPTTTTQKSITSAGKLRGESTQTESNIPSLKLGYDPAKSLTPGGGLAERDTSKPFDPSKPFTPGSQTSAISGFEGDAHLVVYSNYTHAKIPPIAKYCVSTHSSSVIKSLRTEAPANPYCIDADFYGTLHTVQAPGTVEIKVIASNFDTVQTDCKFYIYPKESRSCMLNFINK